MKKIIIVDLSGKMSGAYYAADAACSQFTTYCDSPQYEKKIYVTGDTRYDLRFSDFQSLIGGFGQIFIDKNVNILQETLKSARLTDDEVSDADTSGIDADAMDIDAMEVDGIVKTESKRSLDDLKIGEEDLIDDHSCIITAVETDKRTGKTVITLQNTYESLLFCRIISGKPEWINLNDTVTIKSIKKTDETIFVLEILV